MARSPCSVRTARKFDIVNTNWASVFGHRIKVPENTQTQYAQYLNLDFLFFIIIATFNL